MLQRTTHQGCSDSRSSGLARFCLLLCFLPPERRLRPLTKQDGLTPESAGDAGFCGPYELQPFAQCPHAGCLWRDLVFHLRLVSLLRRAVPFLLALYFILLFFVDGTLRRTWRFLRPGWPLRRWRRRRHMARGSHGARGPLEQQRMQAEEIEGFRCYTAACCVCPVCISTWSASQESRRPRSGRRQPKLFNTGVKK